MTVVLLFASRFAVVQVSDRRLTDAQTGREFDATSNKSWLFESESDIMVGGYCGAAFAGSVPTDEWVGAQLKGSAVRDEEGILATLSLGSGHSWANFGHARENLIRQMTLAASSGLFGNDPLGFPQIAFAGFRQYRNGLRPLGTVIRWSEAEQQYVRGETPRQWHVKRPNSFLLLGIGRLTGYPAVVTELRSRLARVSSVEDVSAAMVTAVRALANRDVTVGKDCLVVEVAAQRIGDVRIAFDSVEGRELTMQTPSRTVTVPVAYSPWIVGRRIMQAPAVMSHSMSLSTGRLRIQIVGPQNAPPNEFIFAGHPRRGRI